MRTTIEDNKKHFQQEIWTCGQSLAKFDSDSLNLLNAKTETKKVQFVDNQLSTLDKEERQLDSADSIGKEMTHFKPIRLMPLSALYISDKILKIPSIRHTNSKEKSFFFQAPAKSKFKPEVLIKSRRSAFCLVADNHSTENQKRNLNKSNDRTDSIPANSYFRRNGEKSKEKIICNIMLNKTNCKKMLQEKDDFELAKMLQEYDSNGRTANGNGCSTNNLLNQVQEPSARTRRYYLRTRSKQISYTKDVVVPTKRAKIDGNVTTQGDSNKVVVNGGRKTRSSGPLNGLFDKEVERLRRGRKRSQFHGKEIKMLSVTFRTFDFFV